MKNKIRTLIFNLTVSGNIRKSLKPIGQLYII